MPRRSRQDLWVKVTTFAHRRITIKERTPGGPLQVEFRVAGRKIRRSTGVRAPAEEESMAASEWVKKNVPRLIEEAKHGRRTLADILEVYRARRIPQLEKKRVRQSYKRVIRHAKAVFGDVDPQEIGQQHVDAYEAVRRDGGVGPTTIASEMAIFGIILNWCTKFAVEGGRGRTLLDRNPLADLRLPSLPPSRQMLTPVATQARFLATIAHAMCVDATGALLVLVVMARCTGRRFGAYARMEWVHVLFTAEEVLAAAARWAPSIQIDGSEWPYGAIFWPAATDKMGQWALIPMTRTIARYLRDWRARSEQNDRLGRWVFPSVTNLKKPIPYTTASSWLRKAERHALRLGEPTHPLTGGIWHPYRRLFRTERAGTFHDKFTAAAGGWSYPESGRFVAAMNRNYLKVTPAALYEVMDLTPAIDVDFGHTC